MILSLRLVSSQSRQNYLACTGSNMLVTPGFALHITQFSNCFLYVPELIDAACVTVGVIHSPNFLTFPHLQAIMIGFMRYLLFFLVKEQSSTHSIPNNIFIFILIFLFIASTNETSTGNPNFLALCIMLPNSEKIIIVPII